MTYQHKELAAGRWQKMPICEQLANVGSEVDRALNWRAKGNIASSLNAFDRALELVDLSLEGASNYSKRREIARLREAMLDYFIGKNEFGSTDESWRRYFMPFALVVRKGF